MLKEKILIKYFEQTNKKLMYLSLENVAVGKIEKYKGEV